LSSIDPVKRTTSSYKSLAFLHRTQYAPVAIPEYNGTSFLWHAARCYNDPWWPLAIEKYLILFVVALSPNSIRPTGRLLRFVCCRKEQNRKFIWTCSTTNLQLRQAVRDAACCTTCCWCDDVLYNKWTDSSSDL